MEERNKFQEWCKGILPVVQAASEGADIEAYVIERWEPKGMFNGFSINTKYRVKPRTITVNGFEVPEPMHEAPTAGDEYFTPNITGDDLLACAIWNNDRFDKRLLSRGLCHATQESAIAHTKAMLGLDPNGDSK